MVVFPHAKINIGLYVAGQRPDGYHDIETVFYPAGWCDVLEVLERDDPAATGVAPPVRMQFYGRPIPGNPDENLCIKAYRLFGAACKLPPADAWLLKNIPPGSGLGGGSSDGSFMLQLLAEKYPAPKQDGIHRLASALGSDPPFFLVKKPVFATGRGDIMEEIGLDLSRYILVIACPPVPVSTAWAYAEIAPRAPEKSLKDLILLPVNSWKNYIFNAFEPVVFGKYPEIGALKNKLYEMGAIYASLSGSGSSVYGLFEQTVDNGLIINGLNLDRGNIFIGRAFPSCS